MSRSLRRYALLSVAAAFVTIGMKSAAYFVTGSVGLLSDALESGVNLLAAVTAYLTLIYASRPADETHTYGHEKIEFFASGLEGVFILFAGLGTIAYGCERLWAPQQLQSLELGTAIATAAAIVNLVVARILLRVGREQHSIILHADGQHLMADVYTSVGIVGGLILVSLTGYTILDPILAIIVGLNILATGISLVRRSFHGLMDHALSPDEQKKLREAIRGMLPPGMDFHALRTRQAGAKTFAEFHLLVSGQMSVRDAHEYAHKVEDRLCEVMPGITVTIHIEPIDDESSFEAIELARLGEMTLPTEPQP